MCLAIPGKVLVVSERGGMRLGKVDFGGITREVSLDCVPEANIGDYVLVHVGFAISVVDPEEAERTFEALRELEQLAELETPQPEEAAGSRA